MEETSIVIDFTPIRMLEKTKSIRPLEEKTESISLLGLTELSSRLPAPADLEIYNPSRRH